MPNIERKKQTRAVIEIWDSEDHRLYIKVSHHAQIPKLICHPDNILIRFCFLGFPANRVLKIENKSSLRGYVNFNFYVSITI